MVLAEVAAEKVRQEAQRREEEAKSKTDSYSMTGSTSASSLGSTGIKVTRSAELDAPKAGAPAKSGCMGCMGVIVAMLVMGAAGAVWAMG